ncbi:hypothetical protein NGRA_2013 [Nosema granulosis]|uniref:Integrase catalytic domain-containing protein n=1 Tax=Nosema granulosis TaxID=83296 RepID=A0A9P6GXG3_9MICR|nr:hypothetical protein NGRA_2013 [Nosema granulosis]
MKNHITNVLRKCEICQIGNRKTKGGAEMVVSCRKGEKMAKNIMKNGDPKCHVWVGIDYFTRYLHGRVITDRSSNSIIGTLEEWFAKDGVPGKIVSDNAKEFGSLESRNWLCDNEFNHRKVCVISNGSNGRVERAIKTIR